MKIGRVQRNQYQPDEENPYWMSFSDIMSGLLVIFILASLALILELTQTRVEVSDAIRELAKAEQVRRDIVHEVEEELKKQNINVEISENESVIRIPDHLLSFESNRYRIPPSKHVEETVIKIAKVLHEVIVKNHRWKYLDTIFIEGHTDIRQSNRVMGNWGLSTFRAISIWNFWNSNLDSSMSLENLKNHSDAPLFSVSGYGETRPLPGSKETEEAFKKNRRIDIRITVRRPALEEFGNIKRLLEK